MTLGFPARSQIVAMVLLPFILVVLGVLFVMVLSLQGRPFLFASERMRDPDTPFRLFKIRTMVPADNSVEMVLGGHQAHRVTPIGRFLRRSRLDELPQIFNVLRGDIGFIGPRPPLRTHVRACRDEYGRVLERMRPGITGLSTVMLHRREKRLLQGCRTAEEAESVYLMHCLPIKLRLEALYARRKSVWLDLLILWWTIARLLPRLEVPRLQMRRVAVSRLQSGAH